MARKWRTLAVILLLLCWALPSLAWAPSRAVLVVWDTADDTQFERYSRLVKGLKDLRSQGKFDIVAGLDKSIKVYDFNQKAHAQSINHLQLARRQDTPFLAVVTIADGIPGKVMWGKKVVDPEAALNDLQRHFGLVVKPLATPTPTPTPSPSTSPSPPPSNTTIPAEGWVNQGDRWQHADGLSVAPPAGANVKETNGGLNIRYTSTRLFVTLFPTSDGEGHRKELLDFLVKGTKESNPGCNFGQVEVSQSGNLNFSRQEANPNGPSSTLIVGSVWIGQKSLVFLATLYPPSPDGDCRAQLTSILQSVKLR